MIRLVERLQTAVTAATVAALFAVLTLAAVAPHPVTPAPTPTFHGHQL